MVVILDLLIDLNGPSFTCEVHNFGNGIQVPLTLTNLLSFLHLFARRTKAKKLIVDYNQLHEVTFNEILQQINFNEEAIKIIMGKKKEKEYKKVK
jgi:hypothetical protein